MCIIIEKSVIEELPEDIFCKLITFGSSLEAHINMRVIETKYKIST